MSEFEKLNPLRFWCQKVLPLTYDNSLSYDELLCKVVNYLNNIIKDIDAIPDYIKSLLTEERLKEILAELLDELRVQIVEDDEGTKTTASKDRKAGDLLWLNNKLICITRDILAGTEYIEDVGEVGITGNFVYRTVGEQMSAIYSSDNQRLTIYGFVDPSTTIVTRGDTHIYNGATQTIEIKEI